MKGIPEQIPAWLGVAMLLGGIAAPFIVSFARRTAARFRKDDDPKNDKWADLLDAFADAVSRGDMDKAAQIRAQLERGGKR